jgi:tetraacyldisaccharide 4'-kinase
VIVGKERRVSGHLAIDRFHTEVLILDDGFQHLSLKRDVNLLLVDSSSPLADEKLFPRGNLREPLDQVVRADAIILTKAGGDDNIKYLKEKFLDFGSRIPFFRVDYQPVEIRVLGREAPIPLESLGGKRILAFSGIARPESFERTLRNGGAEVVSLEAFPDHYEYLRTDLDRLQDRAHRLGAEAMVTTEKDMVRLRGFAQGPIPLWALSVRHVFQRGNQPRFEAFLWERLGLKR